MGFSGIWRASAPEPPPIVVTAALPRKGTRDHGPPGGAPRDTDWTREARRRTLRGTIRPPPPHRAMSDTPTQKRAAGGGRGGLAELRRQLSTVPNQLTALRLAMLPVLWVLALLGRPVWLGIGVMVASVTDMLDGWLSRRWNQTSEFGSRLDSIADHLL